MVKVQSVCNGAATIITGFACGKGAAFGINLENKVSVELTDDGITSGIKGLEGKEAPLMNYCVEEVLKATGLESGARVWAEPNMPLGVGLKSSSIAANATVLATIEALARREDVDWRAEGLNGVKFGDIDIINLGINAAFRAKVTSTGALDDASASYFGGYAVTDNLGRKIHARGTIDDHKILIYLPKNHKEVSSGGVDMLELKKHEKEVEGYWQKALKGEIFEALTLNGLLHSRIFGYGLEETQAALDAGAIASGLTGTGPAVVAVVDEIDDVCDVWRPFGGKIIEAKTNNLKARILK